MSLRMQALLLRFLENGEIQRVGSDRAAATVNVRVIAATNRVLLTHMAEKTFREDLYYRLNVVEVAIPPLRERREDIPALLAHFLDKYGKRYQRPIEAVPPEVLQRLLAHDYPGNIRELENLVRRLIVLGDPRYILGELQTLPGGPSPPQPPPPTAASMAAPMAAPMAAVVPFPAPPSAVTAPMTYGYPPQPSGAAPGLMAITLTYEIPNAPPGQIDDDYKIDLKDLGRRAANAAEREAIVIMLRHSGGNKREAAERLGISYKAILYKIREFGIGRPRNRRPAAAAATAEAEAEAEPATVVIGSEADLAVAG
jgi:two-component system response regulator AtoC